MKPWTLNPDPVVRLARCFNSKPVTQFCIWTSEVFSHGEGCSEYLCCRRGLTGVQDKNGRNPSNQMLKVFLLTTRFWNVVLCCRRCVTLRCFLLLSKPWRLHLEIRNSLTSLNASNFLLDCGKCWTTNQPALVREYGYLEKEITALHHPNTLWNV